MAKTGLRESRMNLEHALEPEETLQVKNILNFFFFKQLGKIMVDEVLSHYWHD